VDRSAEELQRAQAALTALTKHASWPVLEDERRRKEERIENHILAITLGTPDAIDADEIQYWRGFVQGMRWAIRVPNRAERRLESYLRARGVELGRSDE
jgi:hypothetical protein